MRCSFICGNALGAITTMMPWQPVNCHAVKKWFQHPILGILEYSASSRFGTQRLDSNLGALVTEVQEFFPGPIKFVFSVEKMKILELSL